MEDGDCSPSTVTMKVTIPQKGEKSRTETEEKKNKKRHKNQKEESEEEFGEQKENGGRTTEGRMEKRTKVKTKIANVFQCFSVALPKISNVCRPPHQQV